MRIFLNKLATGDFSFGVIDGPDSFFKESSGGIQNQRIIAFLTLTIPEDALIISISDLKAEFQTYDYELDKTYDIKTEKGNEISFLLDSNCSLLDLLNLMELRLQILIGKF